MSQYWLFLLVPAFAAGYLTHVYYNTKRDIALGRLLEWLVVRDHVEIALRIVRLRLLRWSAERARRPRATDRVATARRDAVETAHTFEHDVRA